MKIEKAIIKQFLDKKIVKKPPLTSNSEVSTNIEAIPRTIYMQSKDTEQKLDKLRDKMRIN